MEGYIDIHCHILPGVDDGAEDLMCSLAMLREAAANKVKRLILTPHQKEGRHCIAPAQIHRAVEYLQRKAREQGIEINLYPGNELYYREGLHRMLEEGEACTLADSFYVLVEFSPIDEFTYIRNGLYKMLVSGYLPVIAHAERYQCLVKRREYLDELVRMGCFVQINAGSVLGEQGIMVKWYVHGLLKDRLVHFVATDAHDMGKRRIRMMECGMRLTRKYGAEYADDLLHGNALAILENTAL